MAAAVRVLILTQRPRIRNCVIHPLGNQMDQVLLKRVKLLKLGRYETEHIGFISLVVWVVLYPHSDDAISFFARCVRQTASLDNLALETA
jgi:hypothetical protein